MAAIARGLDVPANERKRSLIMIEDGRFFPGRGVVAITALTIGKLILMGAFLAVAPNARGFYAEERFFERAMFAFESPHIFRENIFWLMAASTGCFGMTFGQFEARIAMIKGERIQPYGDEFEAGMFFMARGAIICLDRCVIALVCSDPGLERGVAIETA